MLRGIEEWNRRVVPTQRANAGVDDTVTTRARTNSARPATASGATRHQPRFTQEAYWREGIQRMKDQQIEGVVTLGMRGPGDVKPTRGHGHRAREQDPPLTNAQIIQEVTGREPRRRSRRSGPCTKRCQDCWDKGLARAGRRHGGRGATTTGPTCARSRSSPPRSARAATASTTTSTTSAAAATTSGSTRSLLPNLWEQLNLSFYVRSRPALGRSTSGT